VGIKDVAFRGEGGCPVTFFGKGGEGILQIRTFAFFEAKTSEQRKNKGG